MSVCMCFRLRCVMFLNRCVCECEEMCVQVGSQCVVCSAADVLLTVMCVLCRCRALRSVSRTTDCLSLARRPCLRVRLSSTHSSWDSSNSSTRSLLPCYSHNNSKTCHRCDTCKAHAELLTNAWLTYCLNDSCLQKCLAYSQQFTHMGNVAETARCVFSFILMSSSGHKYLN